MVTRTVTSGMLAGSNGNDVLTGIAQNGSGQIHVYAKAGNDRINLDFSTNINKFSAGHHARGDDDGSNARGSDTFNFRYTNRVSTNEVVVGRLEDFDSRDTLQIEGQTINLNNLPSNVRIVEFNGAHNDANTLPQQWLLINTSTGGHIFYALEGARIDMNGNGGSNSGNMEKHFIHQSDLPNFASLRDVAYVDPQNYVPAGISAQGGLTINDDDENAADVLAVIQGSSSGDLIAAGLNNDNVRGGDGNDRIYGGTGNDTINADNGEDTVYGGHGHDRIIGGKGNDRLYGGEDNDVISGWGGNDRVYGDNGDDRLYGQQGNDTLSGGNGNDKLYASTDNDRLVGGSGNDLLNGGKGTDKATGGSGNDTFEFKTGDLMDWDQLSGSWTSKNAQLDSITDFQIGSDHIEFDNYANVDDMSDIGGWKTVINGNMHFTVQVRATNERILVDVADNTSWSQFFDDGNFLFT